MVRDGAKRLLTMRGYIGTRPGSRRLRSLVAKPGQRLRDPGGRPRRTEQKTLHLVAAFGAQPIELIDGFDAFCGRRDIETAAEAGNRPSPL
jgi:hypothetical protein